ncbi:MAG: amino acid permease [Simkaniaceae bacterium]|nr:amino acid permease [Simkaniaceae bacterium]
MDTQKVNLMRVVSGMLLISGTTIGAGMLGIPLVTGIAGFVPGIFITVLVWFFMLCTGLLFLEVTLWLPDGSNILSMTERFLGRKGKYISGGMFIFLYYSLMIAYFAAGAPILAEALKEVFGFQLVGYQIFLVFGLIFGAIVGIGPKSIDRTNILLSLGMILAWFLLIGKGSSSVESKLLYFTNWKAMIFAAPMLFGAFGFHNVVPSLCSYLKRDVKVLRASIFWGSFIPLIVYLVWQWLIIGSIPQDQIKQTLLEGNPITTAFQEKIGTPWVAKAGQFFAFFAIVTSIIGVSFSMVDFLGDGMNIKRRVGVRRVGLTLLTFTPPFIFATLNPHIFDTALGLAGGYGEAFLNGLLPIALVWIGRYVFKMDSNARFFGGKFTLFFLTLCALLVICIETVILFSKPMM